MSRFNRQRRRANALVKAEAESPCPRAVLYAVAGNTFATQEERFEAATSLVDRMNRAAEFDPDIAAIVAYLSVTGGGFTPDDLMTSAEAMLKQGLLVADDEYGCGCQRH